MYKFAHIADCHLGAFSEPVLRDLSLSAFEKAIGICLEEQVDFILVSGDLFHSNIPDMGIVKQAVEKMKRLRDAGIEIYVIYGSHDFSPNEASMVDVLASTGLFHKVVKGEVVDEKLRLEFFTDAKTKAKLVGISGRKLGLEKEYYEILDRESLEKEPGFKVFAFHTALDELKPASLAEMESMPISYLPKGFGYYAGGHIHLRIEKKMEGYPIVRYPGTLFGYSFRDLEHNAAGEKPGFYIVSFDDKIGDIRFMETPVCDYLLFEYDATDKNSAKANEELLEKVRSLSVKDKLVLLRVEGELSGGKTSDINFTQLKSILRQNGAVYANINRYALSSREYSGIKVEGRDISEVENKLLGENIGAVKVSDPALKGQKGVSNAIGLLGVLRHDKKVAEKKKDYDERMMQEALETMKLKEALE